ncbi:hypothetical protein [Aeromicrobium sp. PE09-221]|uniref:hypothetical protein n=1 Tax=Aeromicrobium sp. PE09-221 TaxID=1898043 RepID=UPI001F1D8A5D|nr:hypothetical protein [Aeromicrobium sp. PE09-221]
MAEPAHVGQLGSGAAVTDQHPERAAGVDGGQLTPIADEHDLRSDLGRMGGDFLQRERARQGGLVDQHELTGRKIPAALAMLVTPLGGVLRADAQVRGPHVGSGSRRCQPDHRPDSVLAFPRTAQRTECGGLHGPGRSGQQIQGSPRALAVVLNRGYARPNASPVTG